MSNYHEMTHDELVVRAIKKVQELDKDQLINLISTRAIVSQDASGAVIKKVLLQKIKKLVDAEGCFAASKFAGISEPNVRRIYDQDILPYNMKAHIIYRNIERYEVNKGVDL